eukprot:GCRY01003853.1.p1 GENE.GCRY01003853.1~~GCRY01003853.1.p1  ORF type:complete len:411 (+),score=40.77 GCRY01003853.1:94-1326(+)
MANTQPITRDFLKKFYADFPIRDPPQQLTDTLQHLLKLQKQIIDNNKERENAVQEEKMEHPHKIDENLWRCKHMCALIHDIAEKSETNSKNKDCGTLLKNIINLCDSISTNITSWQDRNKQKITNMVSDLLPKDFRTNMVRRHQEKSEVKMQQEVADLEKKGCTIREKYDLLWAQQLKRRQGLVDMGNAKGMYKFILKYVGGCPQVLLDFAKTVNDDNGPMEEMRIKYAPYLYVLFSLLNVTARSFLAISFLEDENFALHLKDIHQAMTIVGDEMTFYLDFMWNIVEKSPFFISAHTANLQSSPEATTIVVKSGSSYELSIPVPDANTTFRWEITLKSHDIMFGVAHQASENEGEKKEMVLALKKIIATDGSTVGELTATRPGIYFLVFDNSYSYFTKKSLDLKVKLIDS